MKIRILKQKIIQILIVSLLISSLYSNDRPYQIKTISQEQLKIHPELIKMRETAYNSNMQEFGWLKRVSSFIILANGYGEVSSFFEKSKNKLLPNQYEEIEKYFILRLRNFVSELKHKSLFTKEHIKDGRVRFQLNIELYKYNDKLELYYGLIELEASFLGKNKTCPNKWSMRVPIAGAKTQIKEFIKKELDSMAEKFASDYYYMQDLKK